MNFRDHNIKQKILEDCSRLLNNQLDNIRAFLDDFLPNIDNNISKLISDFAFSDSEILDYIQNIVLSQPKIGVRLVNSQECKINFSLCLATYLTQKLILQYSETLDNPMRKSRVLDAISNAVLAYVFFHFSD